MDMQLHKKQVEKSFLWSNKQNIKLIIEKSIYYIDKIENLN